MNRSVGTVIFSHGKESGPWGAKITAMAAIAREFGYAVESIDFRGMDDPSARVEKLVAAAAAAAGRAATDVGTASASPTVAAAGIASPIVLVGSSMGGHVAAAAAARVRPSGLFLLAPAFYMPGFEAHTPQDIPCPTVIVHGWHDDIVPVEHSVRWAREHRATLHLLDSGHRLEDRIPLINRLLGIFLGDLNPSG